MRLRRVAAWIVVATAGLYAWILAWLHRYRDDSKQAQSDHIIVFVGGLQRTGTTVATKLLMELFTEAVASCQTPANVGTRETLERVQRWRGMSRSYFSDVLKSGGLEGKFVQNVYPYTYLLRDWGQGPVDKFTAGGAASPLATAGNGRLLWSQWADFWDLSKRVLIEKTPENVVMAPFLQSVMRERQTSFVIMLRHPLAWSLAIDKWLKNKYNRASTLMLRPLAARITMWLDVVSRFFADAPVLRRAAALHAERVDLSSASVRRRTLVRLVGRLIGDTPPELGDRSTKSTVFRGYSRANLQYIACWLQGGHLSTKGRRHCAEAKPNIRLERRAELNDLRARFQSNLSTFGYFLPDFHALLCSPHRAGAACQLPRSDVNWSLLDVGLRLDGVDARYRSLLLLQ